MLTPLFLSRDCTFVAECNKLTISQTARNVSIVFSVNLAQVTDSVLLRRYAMSAGKQLRTFRRIVVPPCLHLQGPVNGGTTTDAAEHREAFNSQIHPSVTLKFP